MFGGSTSSPFKTTATTSAAPAFGSTFGTGLGFGANTATNTAAGIGSSQLTFGSGGGNLTFGNPATTTQSLFGFSTPATTTKSSLGTGFGTFSTPGTTTTTFSLLGSSFASTGASSTGSTATFQFPAKTTPAVSSTAPGSTTGTGDKQITFTEMVDLINKWTWDIYDLEKQITSDVDQLKTWESTLNDNAQKIIEVHKTFEEQKRKQEELEHALDSIGGQQQELSEALSKIENMICGDNRIDLQSSNTYTEAQIIDAKLQKMRDDLTDIIDSADKRLPSKEDSDPITQITRVLVLFNNSLESIDKSVAELQKRLKDCTATEDLYRSIADIGLVKK